ncbi:hypothetical protein VTH06DRAFT_6695 [Thermothelomyces fergusii]
MVGTVSAHKKKARTATPLLSFSVFAQHVFGAITPTNSPIHRPYLSGLLLLLVIIIIIIYIDILFLFPLFFLFFFVLVIRPGSPIVGHDELHHGSAHRRFDVPASGPCYSHPLPPVRAGRGDHVDRRPEFAWHGSDWHQHLLLQPLRQDGRLYVAQEHPCERPRQDGTIPLGFFLRLTASPPLPSVPDRLEVWWRAVGPSGSAIAGDALRWSPQRRIAMVYCWSIGAHLGSTSLSRAADSKSQISWAARPVESG